MDWNSNILTPFCKYFFSLCIHLKAYDAVWRVPYHIPSEGGTLKKLVRSIETCLMEPAVKSAWADI
jgi:hypothetical protein